VGYVAGAHGVHGALVVHLHDAESTSLEPGRRVHLHRQGEDSGVEHEVTTVAPGPGKANRWRVTLEAVGDRDTAQALRGSTLWVERDQLPPLADDEYYLVDAIGLPVQREREGNTQALGRITGLTSNGAQDLFEVRWRGPDGRARQWLLPILPHTIVDLGKERVLVDLPLGLLPDAFEEEP